MLIHSEHIVYERVLLFAPASARSQFEQLLQQHHIPLASSSSSSSQLGWRLVPMIEGDLKSSDLGEKLKAALNTVREQGLSTSSVVFIGNDCPELSTQLVHQAMIDAATHARAFIAPASDGGYVLLGTLLFVFCLIVVEN